MQMLRILAIRIAYMPFVVMFSVRSKFEWIKSLSSSPRTVFSQPHEGEPILLLAIWEKGDLRPDIVRLLKAAHSQNMYTYVINTAQLTDPQSIAAYVDHYVERANFGADFGSYKLGFEWILDSHKVKSAPRVIMANDSVYYISDRIENMLRTHVNSQHEVLGVTENFEYTYHLGSFFISFSDIIRTNPLLKKFWTKFHPSQVRTRNIRLGELELSKCLLRCVTKREALDSQINVRLLRAKIAQSPESVPQFLDHISSTGYLNKALSAPNPSQILKNFFTFFGTKGGANLAKKEDSTSAVFPSSFQDQFVSTTGTMFETASQNIQDYGTSMVLANFIRASPIHYGALTTMLLGIPIIKGDLLYRGAIGSYEAIKLTNMLSEPDRTEFSHILLSRPFGADSLHGWRRLAFYAGLI